VSKAKTPSTKKTWRDSLPIDMLLSAVSVLVVAQSISEIPEGLMNNPVYQSAKSPKSSIGWSAEGVHTTMFRRAAVPHRTLMV
jgi:hypothetical protein